MEDVRLTQFSHGAGCGCKLAPAVLSDILANSGAGSTPPELLVGHDRRDDAAVFDLGDGTAVVSTTDFFMPIVDDPEDFGRIAAANAMSDIWAMGGRPLMAIAVLGWPVDRVPAEVAGRVLAGARETCAEVGVPIAGGHSIDNPEPLFGLAVTGRVRVIELKRNGGARPGARLYLTKPLGVGILATAQKKGLLRPEHADLARDVMVRLNDIGAVFATDPAVQAMTDVTGFGLLGHLGELCDASDASARLDFDAVPFIDRAVLTNYVEQGAVPGGTRRNFDSYGAGIGPLTDLQRALLCDPQTSGGLLVAVDDAGASDFEATARRHGLDLRPLGALTARAEHRVSLR